MRLSVSYFLYMLNFKQTSFVDMLHSVFPLLTPALIFTMALPWNTKDVWAKRGNASVNIGMPRRWADGYLMHVDALCQLNCSRRGGGEGGVRCMGAWVGVGGREAGHMHRENARREQFPVSCVYGRATFVSSLDKYPCVWWSMELLTRTRCHRPFTFGEKKYRLSGDPTGQTAYNCIDDEAATPFLWILLHLGSAGERTLFIGQVDLTGIYD